MATTTIDRGIFCIRWMEGRKRHAISLSGKKFSRATVEEVCRIVERLVYLKENPTEVPDKRTKTWLEDAHPIIQNKLAKAELIVMPESHTTGELWEVFLKSKNNIKQTTRDGYNYAEQRFFGFFDRKTDLRELTPERFKEWKDFLRTEYRSQRTGKPLVTSTIAGTVTKTKAVFNWAKAKKWITESPLDEVGRGSFVNKENDRFVTMDEYRRLLEVCPCADWRAIIALARIGGLRCPSELLRLRWTDVNWEKSRFYVTASKTERYKGHEGRLVPLWPALQAELGKLYFAQPERTEFVINRYRDPERTNLGTQFARIVKMAGIEEIKRPFDNMRASRSTEVYAEYGAFLESKWIGHSTKTAMKHYLQVREEDFERAVGDANRGNEMLTDRENIFPATGFDFPTTPKSDSGHISDQQGAAIGCKESQQEKTKAS